MAEYVQRLSCHLYSFQKNLNHQIAVSIFTAQSFVIVTTLHRIYSFGQSNKVLILSIRLIVQKKKSSFCTYYTVFAFAFIKSECSFSSRVSLILKYLFTYVFLAKETRKASVFGISITSICVCLELIFSKAESPAPAV